ncbi:MAG TPA: HAD hydrolase-like protein, partial [Candidatus Methanofastidiosa archaeon]|nr:HAD hydrolase-like protein [Candidatus Methanofastidiosa archaeon]
MIKAVFFDYGGTLFDYCPSNYQLLGSVARKYGIDMPDTDPMLSVAFQRQEERMMELFRTRGKPKFSLLKEEDWITLDLILLDAVGVKDPGALGDLVDKFEKREFDFKIYPESIEVIEYLKGRGFGLGIITNLCGPARIVERYEQLREHGILELFDVV